MARKCVSNISLNSPWHLMQNEVNIPSNFKEILLKAKQNATVKKIRPNQTFLSKSMYASWKRSLKYLLVRNMKSMF